MRRAGLAIAWGLAMLSCGGEVGAELGRRSAVIPSPDVDAPDAGERDASTPPEPPDREPPDPEPFEDPGCPPVGMLPSIEECDPLAASPECPTGESCFPFVDYPAGPCEVERFGTMCLPAGSGTQGDSCSMEPCAAEHICVSTGRGTQCVRLCAFGTGAPSVCAPGLLCLPIDIDGFGGCL